MRQFILYLSMLISIIPKRLWIQGLSTSRRGWWIHGYAAPASLIRLKSTLLPATNDNDALYQELKTLTLEIQKHDDLYYTLSQPILSDDEYDALVRREAELCQDYPELEKRLRQEGILTRFGGRLGGLSTQERSKVNHLQPMLSLDNVHTEDEVDKWIQRVLRKLPENTTSELQILTEPKLDGLSLSLRYNTKGELEWAATRGDGLQGQLVTLAVKDMQSIPMRIDSSGSDFEIRGEVVLPLPAFETLRGDLDFSNARNAASGILLRKANNQTLRRALNFYAYDVIGMEMETGSELRSFLTSMGFRVPEPHLMTILHLNQEPLDLQPLLGYLEALRKHKENQETTLQFSNYDMDGAVHKICSIALRNMLGNSNKSPRWAVAHKLEPPTVVTKLLGVQVQVGRTGALTPVAILEPVDLQGVTIQRATLHNFRMMQQVLGGEQVPVGTMVLVRRAGEVIPQVVKRVEDLGHNESVPMVSLEVPTHCPACSSEVVWEISGNNETGQVLRCGGQALKCPPRAIGALEHAFSRDALDVSGLSQARIQQLMEQGILKVPVDIFSLASTAPSSQKLLAKLADLPGWGPKSAQNLQKVVDGVVNKGVSLGRFIYSLGIRYMGQHTSNLVASVYGDVDCFLQEMEEASTSDSVSFAILREDTETTKGIGPVLISSLEAFALDKQVVESAKSLAKVLPVAEEQRQQPTVEGDATSQKKIWSGWAVVFTGSLPELSRPEAQALAKDVLGAKSTPNRVSKTTSLVVAGEKGGKKLQRAQELGVTVMSGEDFEELIRHHKN
jgi:DNA ligase (NAD+)